MSHFDSESGLTFEKHYHSTPKAANMKRNILFVFLIMCVWGVSAQQTVYFRNGNVINGSVSENTQDNTISIKIEDGTVMVYDKDQVLRITDATSETPQIPIPNRTEPRKGYHGSVDIAYHLVFYDDVHSYSYGAFITTIHGGYVLPYLYIGGGGGLGFRTAGNRGDYFNNSYYYESYVRHRDIQICLPGFLNVRGFYPLKSGNGGPFIDSRTGFNLFNIGINHNTTSSIFTSLAVGWSWDSCGSFWDISTGWQYENTFDTHHNNHWFFRFGFEF